MNHTHTVLITLFLIEQRRLAKYALVINHNDVGFDFYESIEHYGEHAQRWIALTLINTDAELIKVELIECDLPKVGHQLTQGSENEPRYTSKETPDAIMPLVMETLGERTTDNIIALANDCYRIGAGRTLKGEDLETFQGPTAKELSQELGRLLQIEYQEGTQSHAGLYTDSTDDADEITLDGRITHQRLGELILKALTANATMTGPTKQQTLGEANMPRTDQEFIDLLESTTKKGGYSFTPHNPPSLDEIDTLRKMDSSRKPPIPQRLHMPVGPTHHQPNGSEWQQWEVDTDNSVSHYWECISPEGSKDRYPSDQYGWIDAYKHPCTSIGLRVIVDLQHEGEEPQARTDKCVRLPQMGIDPWLKFGSLHLSRWMPQPQMLSNKEVR